MYIGSTLTRTTPHSAFMIPFVSISRRGNRNKGSIGVNPVFDWVNPIHIYVCVCVYAYIYTAFADVTYPYLIRRSSFLCFYFQDRCDALGLSLYSCMYRYMCVCLCVYKYCLRRCHVPLLTRRSCFHA